MHGALRLVDELLRAAAQDDGGRLGGLAGEAREDVEALGAHLLLLKALAGAQHVGGEAVERRLHAAARRARDALQVVAWHAARTKQAAVRKVLRRQVANGQLGQDDLRAALHAHAQLLVDDVPLRIHDGLVARHVLNAHLWGGWGAGVGWRLPWRKRHKQCKVLA